jgi:signal transduction histidine kinase
MANDLRAPFNGFLGLTEIIAKESLSLKSDEIQKMGETMWHSAKNLFKLLENLLQWSQMEQGLISFNPGVFRLLTFAEESFSSEFLTAENKGIEVNFEIPYDIFVLADMKMLRSILCNLYSNATKFTSRGGQVFVSASYSSNNTVEISIRDTGIGMSKEIQSKLFRLNEQVNRKGTDGELSTGLGLFLCKEFIEKHGGTIWVESQKDLGSTFHFTIPCNS